MPAKGEKMSDEHKEKMRLGKERAKAQKEAQETHDQEIADYRDQVSKDLGGGPAVTQEVVTQAVGEAVEEWGPFDDNRVVTTPHGEFGVSFRQVLYFKDVERFDARAGRMVTTAQRFYRPATKAEMGPILVKVRKRRKANALAQSGG